MARKLFFDRLDKKIGMLLRENGFKTHHGRIHSRMVLEIQQREEGLLLINLAQKKWVNIGTMIHPSTVLSFIKTGILPYSKSIKSLETL